MGRSLRCNWDAFWSAALKDHCHAGLIWNERTRSELREALQVRRHHPMPIPLYTRVLKAVLYAHALPQEAEDVCACSIMVEAFKITVGITV